MWGDNCSLNFWIQVPSWSWSYGSWIYNYLCYQWLSPLKLRVQILLMARCTQYNIIWKSLSVTCSMSVVFTPRYWELCCSYSNICDNKVIKTPPEVVLNHVKINSWEKRILNASLYVTKYTDIVIILYKLCFISL
jgi:hypothetical protein